MDPVEANKVWSQFGFNPQAFPIYYPLGPANYLGSAGTPSGDAGARVELSQDLSNFPHLLYGVRVETRYDLPNDLSASEVELARYIKEFVDSETLIEIALSQQSVAARAVDLRTLQGNPDRGSPWHSFAQPFPMAGGNNIVLRLTRETSYPTFRSQPIIPRVYATLFCSVLRADMQTIAPMRVKSGY